MGRKRINEVTVTVDIDVDDIIEDIDDDVIAQEVRDRELYVELDDWFMTGANEDDLLDALCSKLSLTKADALREVYYNIKDGSHENRNY